MTTNDVARRVVMAVALSVLPACSPACFLKPTEAFDAGKLASAPDYSEAGSWAARPDAEDKADFTPPGVEDAQADAPADVFFVHPTTWFDREVWNDTLDPKTSSREMTDEMIVSLLASTFNGCCRVFVPRYRQVTIGAFYGEPEGRTKAFDVAYGDVERAFDHFIAQESNGRPFIVAGHSQGSIHAMRLLEKIDADESLRGRLVAAYIPGAGHPMKRFGTAYAHLKPCEEPTQTMCVASWDTYREGAAVEGADPIVYWNDGEPTPVPKTTKRQCTNPVSWRGGEEASKKEAHLGAVEPNNVGNGFTFIDLLMSSEPLGLDVVGLKKPRAKMVSARCEGPALRVPDLSTVDYPAMETQPGNYHMLDYELFYMDIRANAVARVKAWTDAKGATTP